MPRYRRVLRGLRVSRTVTWLQSSLHTANIVRKRVFLHDLRASGSSACVWEPLVRDTVQWLAKVAGKQAHSGSSFVPSPPASGLQPPPKEPSSHTRTGLGSDCPRAMVVVPWLSSRGRAGQNPRFPYGDRGNRKSGSCLVTADEPGVQPAEEAARRVDPRREQIILTPLVAGRPTICQAKSTPYRIVDTPGRCRLIACGQRSQDRCPLLRGDGSAGRSLVVGRRRARWTRGGIRVG
jgi:hypothetical protein